MIRGLNTNIRRNDRIYHIQTEDSGVKSAFITAHLFLDGAVLASVRTDYADIADLPEEQLAAEVAERMRKAHRQMITRLTSGGFDEKKKTAFTESKSENVNAVLEDDSSLVDENEGDSLAERPNEAAAAASEFQALLEYDDEEDDEPEIKHLSVKQPLQTRVSAVVDVEPEDSEMTAEQRKIDKSQDGMTRSERALMILSRFDAEQKTSDFSVSERIRQLLDGE